MKKMIFLLTYFYLPTVFAQQIHLNFIDVDLKVKKEAYQKGNPELVKEVDYLIDHADALLEKPAHAVTEKNFTPPSGTKHDYMSMGPYWWPDSSKKEGLPYIRKDGEVNPEIQKITDHLYMSDLNKDCKVLSLAYYFTEREKYAAKMVQLLQVWFLNDATKMNPNLNFGQAIPGITDGRGIGIIESRSLADLTDWISLLSGSKAFTAETNEGIHAWYKDYLRWMLNSKNGIDEYHAKNNHGTHYDVQVATFALFVGNLKLAKNTINQSKKRLEIQILPNGKQPLELARTKAYGYSTMNLEGWFNLAQLGESVGIDLWHYQTPDGASIQKALDWLIPYALNKKPKEYQQIVPYHQEDIYHLLLVANKKYPGRNYSKLAASISNSANLSLDQLLYL